MRVFSDIEKEIIKRLNQSQRGQRNVINLLDPFLEKCRIVINLRSGEARFRFEIQEGMSDDQYGWIINKVEKLQELIAILVKLLEYLENNGFLVVYRITPDRYSEEVAFGRGTEDFLKLDSPFPDASISALLKSYIYREVVPLGTLYELENSHFRSPDEVRFRRSQRAIWAAISVSLLIGVAGIVWSVIASRQQNASEIERMELERRAFARLESRMERIASIHQEMTEQIRALWETLREGRGLTHKNQVKGVAPGRTKNP